MLSSGDKLLRGVVGTPSLDPRREVKVNTSYFENVVDTG